MKDREETIKWTMSYCQHYDVVREIGVSIQCKKGMDIKKVCLPNEKQTKGKHSQPCIYGHLVDDVYSVCEHWLRKTRAMGEKRADSAQKMFDMHIKVMPVVGEWRKKLPIGKSEVIECPACGGGLHLSQAASNGHIHGKCETKDCVSWME